MVLTLPVLLAIYELLSELHSLSTSYLPPCCPLPHRPLPTPPCPPSPLPHRLQTAGSLKLGSSLLMEVVPGRPKERYEDLDEVAARFVEPLQANLAKLTAHRKWKGLAWEKAQVGGWVGGLVGRGPVGGRVWLCAVCCVCAAVGRKERSSSAAWLPPCLRCCPTRALKRLPPCPLRCTACRTACRRSCGRSGRAPLRLCTAWAPTSRTPALSTWATSTRPPPGASTSWSPQTASTSARRCVSVGVLVGMWGLKVRNPNVHACIGVVGSQPAGAVLRRINQLPPAQPSAAFPPTLLQVYPSIEQLIMAYKKKPQPPVQQQQQAPPPPPQQQQQQAAPPLPQQQQGVPPGMMAGQGMPGSGGFYGGQQQQQQPPQQAVYGYGQQQQEQPPLPPPMYGGGGGYGGAPAAGGPGQFYGGQQQQGGYGGQQQGFQQQQGGYPPQQPPLPPPQGFMPPQQQGYMQYGARR